VNLPSLERLFHNAVSACQQASETLYSTMEVVREFAAENNLAGSELAVPLGVSLSMADKILSGDDLLVPGVEGRHATPAFLVKAAIQDDVLAMDSSVLSIRELSARELEITGDPDPDTKQRLDQQAHAAGLTLHWHVMAAPPAGAPPRSLGRSPPRLPLAAP